MTFPEYAKPPTPGSAIQHVSRRSSTRRPSRVTNCSARNGTSSTKVWTESETGGVDDAAQARRGALDESSDAADSKRSDASVQPDDDDASLERRCVLPAATEHSFAPRVTFIVVVEEVRHVRVSVLGSVGESGEARKRQSDDSGEATRLRRVMRRRVGRGREAESTRRPRRRDGDARSGMGPGPAWSIARARMAPHAASRCDGRGARGTQRGIASAASASWMVFFGTHRYRRRDLVRAVRRAARRRRARVCGISDRARWRPSVRRGRDTRLVRANARGEPTRETRRRVASFDARVAPASGPSPRRGGRGASRRRGARRGWWRPEARRPRNPRPWAEVGEGTTRWTRRRARWRMPTTTRRGGRRRPPPRGEGGDGDDARRARRGRTARGSARGGRWDTRADGAIRVCADMGRAGGCAASQPRVVQAGVSCRKGGRTTRRPGMRSPRVEKEISAYTLVCANSHHGYVTFSRFGVLGSQTHQSVRESAWRAIFHFRGGGSKRSACNASRVRRVAHPAS